MTTVTAERTRPGFWILLAVVAALFLVPGCKIPERIVPIEPGTPVDRYGLPINPEAAYGYSDCRRAHR